MDSAPGQPTRQGLIDIHCHLIPSVDDGARDFAESLETIRQLKRAGFVASICTPHMWPNEFDNKPDEARALTAVLQREIDQAGIDYRVFPGGELRLWPDVIGWMETHGVPNLAESRCVLVDMWIDRWPKWANQACQWLIDRNYQPILAHPERINIARNLDTRLRELEAIGVMLQCNFQSMTGENGYLADRIMRQLLSEQRVQLLALDTHGLRNLDGRLDGLAMVEVEYGAETVTQMTRDAVRQHILPGIEL
jgi:protein-tyrosine phosphatase